MIQSVCSMRSSGSPAVTHLRALVWGRFGSVGGSWFWLAPGDARLSRARHGPQRRCLSLRAGPAPPLPRGPRRLSRGRRPWSRPRQAAAGHERWARRLRACRVWPLPLLSDGPVGLAGGEQGRSEVGQPSIGEQVKTAHGAGTVDRPGELGKGQCIVASRDGDLPGHPSGGGARDRVANLSADLDRDRGSVVEPTGTEGTVKLRRERVSIGHCGSVQGFSSGAGL